MLFWLSLPQLTSSDVICTNYTQQIDHFDARMTDSYLQLVCYDTQFIDPHTFMWDRIIYEIPDFRPINLTSPFSYSVIQLANRTKSTLLTAELRFIGHAWPSIFPNSSFIVYDHATIEENVADIAYLLSNLTNNIENPVSFVIGSGYGGNLAAWSRLKFPQYISGAWASSAPISALGLDHEYDRNYLKKLTQYPGCKTALPNTLKGLHDDITSNIVQIRNSTRALFGLPSTIRDAAALFVIYETLEMMYERNDQHGFLTALCQSNLSLIALASKVNDTLSDSNLLAIDLDPDAIPDIFCSPKARDRKQIWKTKCFDLGHFHIPSDDFYFRSPLLNHSFYQDICHRTWNISDIGDTNVTNLRFGGRNSRAQSILFTMSQDDLSLHLMLEEEKNWTEILKMNKAQISSLGADLRDPQIGEDPNLTQMRNEAIDQVFAWINETCNHTCVHGSCLLHMCRCELGFTGENCSEVEIETIRFKAVAIAAVVGPTTALIFTALLAWNTILTHTEEHASLATIQSFDGLNGEARGGKGRRRGGAPTTPSS
jgi:hypothetical protein